LFQAKGWKVDPAVWRIDWGVHIQAVGNGAAALEYLGTYVSRTAISDQAEPGPQSASRRRRIGKQALPAAGRIGSTTAPRS
jgi:hypothetical protein